MALQPIPLGPDVLLTQGNGPYADNDNFSNVSGTEPIPMGNGVFILVFPIANPSPPNQVGTIARAFTVNGDGTQNWGNALQLGTTNNGGYGVAIDATRALIVFGLTLQVLTINGLTLTAGTPTLLTMGGPFTGANFGPRPMKVMSPAGMSPTTVLFGMRATAPGQNAIRVQLLQVTGTTVTADFSNALNVEDRLTTQLGSPEMCQVDKYTCALFWFDFTDNASYFGQVQLSPTFDSMADVGFGPSQLYDGTQHRMFEFRELSLGFVLTVGTRQPGSHPVAEILEFASFAHALTKGPVVELTQTAPNPPVSTLLGLAIVGHQAVVLYRRSPVDFGQHARFVALNLGTDAREVQEIGFVDFDLVANVFGPSLGGVIALNPRRVLFMYGTAFLRIERMITVGVPVVPPLRWRQRDDCLTPGTATPCICYNLLPVNVVCVPPWWVRISSSVQFGGGVGPRNNYY